MTAGLGYDRYLRMAATSAPVWLTGSEVVELNHAVAIAQAVPPSGRWSSSTGSGWTGYCYLHSTRDELPARVGHSDESPVRV